MILGLRAFAKPSRERSRANPIGIRSKGHMPPRQALTSNARPLCLGFRVGVHFAARGVVFRGRHTFILVAFNGDLTPAC
jgi:hypothetical protein